jgi:hypothetical protein
MVAATVTTVATMASTTATATAVATVAATAATAATATAIATTATTASAVATATATATAAAAAIFGIGTRIMGNEIGYQNDGSREDAADGQRQ